MTTMEKAKESFASRHAVDAWFKDAAPNFDAFAEMVRREEREKCASMLGLSRADAQLMAGELNLREWLTLSAVLVSLQKRMRSKDEI